MARGCDHAVRVHVDDRHFIVEFNADGEVLRIKERRLYAKGTLYEAWCQASYWVASSHSLGTRDTRPKRIIAAAREKHAAL